MCWLSADVAVTTAALSQVVQAKAVEPAWSTLLTKYDVRALLVTQEIHRHHPDLIFFVCNSNLAQAGCLALQL